VSKIGKNEFYEEFLKICSKISTDEIKNNIYYIYPMAYLARQYNLKNYVQVGINNGENFLPMAYVFAQNMGFSFGVANNMCETTYNDIVLRKEKLGLSPYSNIINKNDSKIIQEIRDRITSIDMLYINFDYNNGILENNIDQFLRLLNDSAFIACTNLNQISRERIVNYEENNDNEPAKKMMLIMSINNFEIYIKTNQSTKRINFVNTIKKKFEYLSIKLYNKRSKIEAEIPRVLVGILTYNHEKYIKACIDGILKQTGNFKLKVIIINDCSTDNSHEVISRAIESNSNENIEIEYIHYKKNRGLVENLKSIIHLARDYDYFTFCEGDDYWITSNRIETHINYLKKHPEVGVSFNEIKLYYNDINIMYDSDIQNGMDEGIYSCESLVSWNYIGNFSCCFYDGFLASKIPDELFNMFTVDWMFNIYCATMSEIGYIKQPMTVYRIHSQGVWSGLGRINSARKLIGYINQYNEFTDFNYDEYFTQMRDLNLIKENDQYVESLNLIIIDDVFPSTRSGFRYQEFTSYLKHIEGTKIMATGMSLPLLSEVSLSEILINYKRTYPEFGGKVFNFNGVWKPVECKLLYFTFLINVYSCLKFAEENKIPFVFTLYPGGGFALENEESNTLLKRVLTSPCFRKVIATQQITYDYLVKNKFCSKEKIEFVFGVVVPLEKIELAEKCQKKHYGVNKDTLDICFVTYEYISYDKDNGYDIFVKVAKELVKKYQNIYFHVVGLVNQNVINISEIEDKIIFYEQKDEDWLNTFFKDKDIILSPNTQGKMFKGFFTGFPTDSCIDAGLQKVAILCTDELGLNEERFIDNEEIVIISPDSKKIVQRIEKFMNNPEKLQSIAEKGQKKIIELYNFEAQIKPRIKLLKEEISNQSV
jgi:glycosyltransferase involved in cell wall biosynthesis